MKNNPATVLERLDDMIRLGYLSISSKPTLLIDAREAIAALITERDDLKNEIDTWRSVFLDIAPDRVLPDRTAERDAAFCAGYERAKADAEWEAIRQATVVQANHG